MRSNLAIALLCLLLGAALADWLSTRDAHAQALPPASSGGTSYTHPSAISLSNGIDSADGGTFTGKLTVDGPEDGGAVRITGGLHLRSDAGYTALTIDPSNTTLINFDAIKLPGYSCIKWGTGYGPSICTGSDNTAIQIGLSLSCSQSTGACTTGYAFYANAGVRVGASGTTIDESYKGSATLDFGSIALGSCADLTLTVTGLADGDPVALAVPNASVATGSQFFAWSSAAATATIRHCCNGAATCDPASGTFVVRSF